VEDFLNAQLLLSESEFRQKVADSTAALAVDTATGRIIYATSHAEKLFECQVENGLGGMPFERLIPSELRERHARHVAGYQKNPHSRAMGHGQMKLRAQALGGNQFPVAITLFPIKKSDRLYVILTIVPLPKSEAA
jgi:PAS domain S-box-containing protein